MPEAATGGVQQKRCSLKCHNIHRKIFQKNFFTEQLQTTASEMPTLQ